MSTNILTNTNHYGTVVSVDNNDNVYSYSGYTILKEDAVSNTLSVYVGTGEYGYSGDGGQATSATITGGLFNFDRSGNLYLVDGLYNVVRKVDAVTGVITTVAGLASTTGGYNGDNMDAMSTLFYSPAHVIVDSYYNLYVSDRSNGRIRKVDSATNIVTTVAGGGTDGTSDGIHATSSSIDANYITFDNAGNLYISEWSRFKIRKVTNLLFDMPSTTPSISPTKSPTSESTYTVCCITAEGGYCDVACDGDDVITAVNSGTNYGVSSGSCGAFSTGWCSASSTVDVVTSYCLYQSSCSVPALNTQFGDPCDGSAKFLYIEVQCGSSSQVSTPSESPTPSISPTTSSATNIITTIAGTGSASYSGDEGSATSASINNPSGVAVDTDGNVYFGDYANNRVRVITSGGIIYTVAGTGEYGLSGDGDFATSARLYMPYGVAVDTSGRKLIISSRYMHLTI